MRTWLLVAALVMVASVAIATDNYGLIESKPNGAAYTQTGDITMSGTDTQIIWAVDNDAVTPSITLEPGTGFYASADNTIGIAANGASVGAITATAIAVANANGAELLNSASSSTVPTLIPDKATSTTGLGANGGFLYFIISGTQAMNISASALTIGSSVAPDLRGAISNGTASTALNINDDMQQTGFNAQAQATIVIDAATTFVATRNVQTIDCTGAETITTITRPAGISGTSLLYLECIDTECTIDDTDDGAANTIDLVGANTDVLCVVDKIFPLVHNGTSWIEISTAAH